MNGPSVTAPDRIVLAVAALWSWLPPSSRPVAPHFSYHAPTSAYQAPYSAVSGAGSFGVSRISSTYFTRVSFCRGAPAWWPLRPVHERGRGRSDMTPDFSPGTRTPAGG